MASLSSKIKQYASNNGVASVDFMTDVLLQDDSNGQGPLHQGMEYFWISETY